MKFDKKSLGSVLIILLILTLTACSSKEDRLTYDEVKDTGDYVFHKEETEPTTTPTEENMTLTPEAFGAVGDGITDDTLAIQAAIDAVAMTGTVNLDAKTYAITEQLILHSDMALRGQGEETVIKILTDSVAINIGTEKVENLYIEDFRITTDIETAHSYYGLINVDGSTLSMITIDGIIFDGPKAYRNGLFIKANSEAYIKDIVIKNCDFRQSGRMGLEIIAFDGLETQGSEIYIYNNRFTNSGQYDLAIGASVVGALSNVRIYQNFFEDNNSMHLEVGGKINDYKVFNNIFAGDTKYMISNTGSTEKMATGLHIYDNVSLADATGAIAIGAAEGAIIEGNTFYLDQLIVKEESHSIQVRYNNLYCQLPSGVLIDRSDNNVIANNYVEMSGETQFNYFRAYQVGAEDNAFYDNFLFSKQEINELNELEGAKNNQSYDNQLVTSPLTVNDTTINSIEAMMSVSLANENSLFTPKDLTMVAQVGGRNSGD